MSKDSSSPNEDRLSAIRELVSIVTDLNPGEIKAISSLATMFKQKSFFWRNGNSTVISREMLDGIGARIRMHHAMSYEPFTKDKFEFAMVGAARDVGLAASKSTRGNPGHDVTIGSKRRSLKTQANTDLKLNKIWISKFRELGQGTWEDDPEHLEGLLKQFLEHLNGYDEILMLRRLPSAYNEEVYELVEIPKHVLALAENGKRLMKTGSAQKGAKPGYCYVNSAGELAFQLYFDGGSERKLQIQHLRKDICELHALWVFRLPEEVAEAKRADRLEQLNEQNAKRVSKGKRPLLFPEPKHALDEMGSIRQEFLERISPIFKSKQIELAFGTGRRRVYKT
jgi:type II restriction enzyme